MNDYLLKTISFNNKNKCIILAYCLLKHWVMTIIVYFIIILLLKTKNNSILLIIS